MPRGHFNSYFFCREFEVILFALSLFLFVVRWFFLPWVFFSLPWGFSFCREVNTFAVTVLGHRTSWCVWTAQKQSANTLATNRTCLYSLQLFQKLFRVGKLVSVVLRLTISGLISWPHDLTSKSHGFPRWITTSIRSDLKSTRFKIIVANSPSTW